MSVVYNQGTNYTLYYNALDYFKTIMTNHPSIAKVTTGDLLDVDTKEFPMYPIGNVNIFNTNIQESTTRFDIQLVIADKIKNKNDESNPVTNAQTIPFYGVDDTIDILANTLAIINDLTSYTEYSVASFDIDGDILCEPFVDRFNNGLAGHVATFTLVTHNDRNRCLFFLINPSGSGYQIQNCATSESYYAVLSQQLATGSVFSSTYPSQNTCYTVLQEVEDYDSWDLVNLPVIETHANCGVCLVPPTTTTTTTSTTSTTSTTTTYGPLRLYEVRTLSASDVDYVNCDNQLVTVAINNGVAWSRIASRIPPLNADFVNDLGLVVCDPCFNITITSGEADVSLCSSPGTSLTDRITSGTHCVKAVGQNGIGTFDWSWSPTTCSVY